VSATAPTGQRAVGRQGSETSAAPAVGWRSADVWHRPVRAVSLAAIVLTLAVALASGQRAAVPVALVGLALGWLLVFLVYRGPERRLLATLFLAAFAVRVAAAVAIHPYLISRLVTPSRDVTYVGFMFEDDRVYDNVAWALARTWLGQIEGVARADGYLINNYTYLTGALYALLGHELVAAKFVNCFFGAVLPLLAFSLGKELGGAWVGRFSALLTAFFPSLVLWSVLNLKDILVVVLITAVMLGALRFARAPSIGLAVGTLLPFALLENLRLYAFFALGWLIPLTFFIANRRPWRRRLAIGLPFALAILSVVYVTNQSQWLGLRYLTDKRQEALDSSRGFGAQTAETGIELEKLPRGEGGWAVQLANAPRVLPYVLFAPFPWSARRPRELAAVPETLVWYALVALVVLALVVHGRRRWRELFLPLAYGGGMVLIFSLIEGNVGTIYRHRAMLMPPAFAVAGLGLAWLRDRQAERRAQSESRLASPESRVATSTPRDSRLATRDSTPVA
jgi:hypothetical protein